MLKYMEICVVNNSNISVLEIITSINPSPAVTGIETMPNQDFNKEYQSSKF